MPSSLSARSGWLMADGPAIDTDVLLKAAAYRIGAELVDSLRPHGQAAALGLTHLIAGRQLARKRGLRDRSAAQAELDTLLTALGRLEPDDSEIEMAADLATRAQERGLPLDPGEAQLVAITVLRSLPLLVTGDKRALSALSCLLDGGCDRAALVGRLACFEQVVASVAKLMSADELRVRVCREPDVDGAMRLACSCGREEWNPDQLSEALESYVGAIRSSVDDLLKAGSLLA